MEIKKVNIIENVEATVLQSEGVGFLLMNPATFKIGERAFKLAVQGSGLALVAVDNPNVLVNLDLSSVLARAVDETKQEV